MFLDSDDWLYPEAAARVLDAFAPGVAKVQFRLHLVNGKGEHIDLFPAPEVSFDDGDVVPLLMSSGRYETTVTSGNAFSRTTLAAILPVPEKEFRISADGYLVAIAPLHGRVVSIEEPLGAYVLHGANTWMTVTGQGLGERFRRSLEHDFCRYEALRRKAERSGGWSCPRNPGCATPCTCPTGWARSCSTPRTIRCARTCDRRWPCAARGPAAPRGFPSRDACSSRRGSSRWAWCHAGWRPP